MISQIFLGNKIDLKILDDRMILNAFMFKGRNYSFFPSFKGRKVANCLFTSKQFI